MEGETWDHEVFRVGIVGIGTWDDTAVKLPVPQFPLCSADQLINELLINM